MRIERTGQAPPLTPRAIRFLIDSLSALSLDDIQAPDDRKADYVCLRGLLAIEIKTLEENGSERIDNLSAEMRQRDDWPQFLGSAPVQSFLKRTTDPEGLNGVLSNAWVVPSSIILRRRTNS